MYECLKYFLIVSLITKTNVIHPDTPEFPLILLINITTAFVGIKKVK